jgi:hypothetical protein
VIGNLASVITYAVVGSGDRTVFTSPLSARYRRFPCGSRAAVAATAV